MIEPEELGDDAALHPQRRIMVLDKVSVLEVMPIVREAVTAEWQQMRSWKGTTGS